MRQEVEAVCAACRSLTVPQPSRDRARSARLCVAARWDVPRSCHQSCRERRAVL